MCGCLRADVELRAGAWVLQEVLFRVAAGSLLLPQVLLVLSRPACPNDSPSRGLFPMALSCSWCWGGRLPFLRDPRKSPGQLGRKCRCELKK